MTIGGIFMSSRRKVAFKITLHIHELNNVPIVTGRFHAKWKIKGLGSVKSKGITLAAPAWNHTVTWNHTASSVFQTGISNDGMLMPVFLQLRITQELNGGKEINKIGTLVLNLAEYVATSGCSTRFILQNSKVNAGLRITITMDQISGETNYSTPPISRNTALANIGDILQTRRMASDDKSIRNYAASFKSLKSTTTYLHSSTSSIRHPQIMRDAQEAAAVDVIDDLFNGGDGNLLFSTPTEAIKYGRNLRPSYPI